MADLSLALLVASRADTRGLKDSTKAVKDLGKEAEGTQGFLSKLAGGLSTFGLAANGVSALTGAVQGLAQSFTGPAQEMEMARARLNAFTKDADKTEEILKAVRSEADKTPFSFGEMASAAASLAPIAQRSGTSLESLLQAAEALSASDPLQGFEGAVVALREAASGDLMSLRERFEVDTRGIKEAMESGVPATEALTEGLAKVGINMDLVRGMANTTQGRLSTFNDMLEGIRRTAGEEILKGFGSQLDSISSLVSENVDVLNDLARSLGQGLAAAIELAGAGFAAFMPVLREVLRGLAANGPAAVDAFRAAVTDVLGAVSAFAKTLLDVYRAAQPVIETLARELQPVFAFLARNLTAVVVPAFVLWAVTAGAAAASTIAALLPVVAPIAAIGLAAMLLKEAWENNWGDIQGKTAAAWDFIRPILETIAAGLARFGEEFLPEAVAAWEGMSLAVQTVWAGLMAFLLPAWQTFANLWSEHWTTIQSVLQLIWDAMTLLVKTALDLASTLILTFLDVLEGDWQGAWDRIKGFLQRTWDGIRQLIDDALALILAGVKTAWETLTGTTDEQWTALAGMVGSIARGLAGGLAQTWDDVNRVAGEWWTTIKNTIWDAISPLVGLIQGAVNAIQTALNSIRVPSISLPSVGGSSSSGGSSGGATIREGGKPGETQSEVDNFNKNAAKADADNRAKAGKGGGSELLGGDFAGKAENAIGWAMSRLGQAGWVGWCERFVENAFGTGGRYASAWSAANALMTNPGGSLANVPRGMLAFFRPDPSNGGFGHVGISLGDGRMVSATNNGPEITGANAYWSNLFAGYGIPKFAGGVRGFGGGLALVGEAGPELVSLPRGADVIPNHRMGSVGGDVHVTLNFGGATVLGGDTRKLARALTDDIHAELLRRRRSTGALGLS